MQERPSRRSRRKQVSASVVCFVWFLSSFGLLPSLQIHQLAIRQLENEMNQGLERITELAFRQCVSKPRSRLSRREIRCINRCVDRYLDGFGAAWDSYTQFLAAQNVMLSQASLFSRSPSLCDFLRFRHPSNNRFQFLHMPPHPLLDYVSVFFSPSC